MIKTITQADHEQLMDFLLPEAAYNLFIIGDIENFGYDSDFQTVYGEYFDDKLQAVLLQYRRNLVVYSPDSQVSDAMVALMKAQDYKAISGKFDVLAPLAERLAHDTYKPTYFAELTELESKGSTSQQIVIATTDADLARANALLLTIEEFGDIPRDDYIANNRYKLAADSADKLYLINDEQGSCIATATTAASNSTSAMVLSVATATSQRNQGLASALVSRIAEDYTKQGKRLCLFYDNPAAGRIYQRLGFKPLGKWLMLLKK